MRTVLLSGGPADGRHVAVELGTDEHGGYRPCGVVLRTEASIVAEVWTPDGRGLAQSDWLSQFIEWPDAAEGRRRG